MVPIGRARGGRVARRVGEQVQRAAATYPPALPPLRPSRLRCHHLCHQQPRPQVRRTSPLRARLYPRRLQRHHPAHLCAVPRCRPCVHAPAARRTPFYGRQVLPSRAGTGPGTHRTAAHRRGGGQGALDLPRQLSSLHLVHARAGKDLREPAGPQTKQAVPAVAVVQRPPQVPHLHLAGGHQDDERAAQGAEVQPHAALQPNGRAQLPALNQTAQVQEAAVRAVLLPLGPLREAQIHEPRVERGLRFQRRRL
mmetsp:Transcript_26367/g.57119  ORF Transcript_26367/g.57119 Transcript_26367/m.57119 type:complete len:252 (-) Transcript_26367:1297-2052(-)